MKNLLIDLFLRDAARLYRHLLYVILFCQNHTANGRRKSGKMVTVQIPTMLRGECCGQKEIALEADTVGAALHQLEQQYPLLYRSVCNETGAIRQHIHVFVNNSLVLGRDGHSTPLQSEDVLSIMTAVSGG